MQDALSGRKASCDERQKVVNAIGRLWDEGIASGASRDGEEAFRRVRQKIEAMSHQTIPAHL